MRFFLFLLLTFSLSWHAGAGKPYSFLVKATHHYKDVVSGSGLNHGGKKSIDSLLSLPSDSASFNRAYSISWEIGLFLLEQGNHAKALDIFNDLRQYLESLTAKTAEDQKKIASVFNVIGAIYEETGLWNDALAMYMNSLQLCNTTDNKAGKAKVFNNLGKLYFNRNDLVKAEELFNKAVEINKQLNIRSELFNNYNNLAGVYNRRHNSARALEYALIALNQLDINRNFYDLSIVYSNIGSLYQDMGNFPVALSYYQQAAGIQESKSFQEALLRSYMSISSLHQAMHKQDSATYYVARSLDLVEKLNNPSQNLFVYRTAAKYFEKVKDYRKAYDLYARYLVLNDSLEALNSLNRIEQIQSVYEVINKEKDNKILQQKIILQDLAIQRQRIVLIGAGTLVLFFIYFLFNIIRQNRREREKNQMIMKQAELLHQQEKNLLISKEHTLELELDYKNRQLTSYAMHLARNNEFVIKTTDELKQISLGINARDKDRSERVRQMISDLQQYSSGHDWEEFRLYFEEVHQSFEKNLSAAFKDLSPNDRKICALLKLGLSTKEIAAITFRELRSVESARNRLRKKLGLAADVNIQNFLSQF
ncbi:MAG: tetratricopeptide repeat protein [Bacteroidota bacterium]